MIRVFSGGRYSLKEWEGLSLILREGLSAVCEKDCDKCGYNYCCREVSQAVTFCDKKANEFLAKGRKNAV